VLEGISVEVVRYWLLSTSVFIHTYPPLKMEQIQCSETSAYKIQTPGNYPKDNILHQQHSESLKTTYNLYFSIKVSLNILSFQFFCFFVYFLFQSSVFTLLYAIPKYFLHYLHHLA
jgi:hypothetical protein